MDEPDATTDDIGNVKSQETLAVEAARRARSRQQPAGPASAAAQAVSALTAALQCAYEADPLPWLARNDPVRYLAVVRSMRAGGITEWDDQRAAARRAAAGR